MGDKNGENSVKSSTAILDIVKILLIFKYSVRHKFVQT